MVTPPSPFLDQPPGPCTHPAAGPAWQQVHGLLATRAYSHEGLPPAELFGLGVYYYCAHKTFSHASDEAVARRLLAQLATQLAAQPPGAWPAGYFDYACGAAWLHRGLAAETQPGAVSIQLASLDQPLAQLAQRLAEAGQLGQPFFRLLRYFDLRRPAPGASLALAHLLAAPGLAGPARPWPPQGGPLALGLAGGLAAELLLLLALAQAGEQGLHPYVREGVQLLLGLRQAVDFAGQRYNLFPDYVQGPAQEPAFGPALSWSRGDMGPALVLYSAAELFADDELRRIAELVGLNTLLRTSAAATGSTSAGFWHGAAGVAHLYQRLHQASGGLLKYEQGYHFWLGETQRRLAQELAGGGYQHCPGSLPEGLAGVGLVLLAAATGTHHAWDTILL